ncbi:MAG: hypothetical protein UU85_C0004G0041 [Candidatus Wolfebacteria bacterium GW2011_GWA2_42_10]|uniref:Uncharacterized protein n=2 Tax=Candidatus Wolfeibacteriota TaxID=1752735 RepID=A0A0G0XLF1_9BACT|nr:MAG: hypothetical protein UU38_C0001G0103 [Candidatus Wolfebacteria bacterium GW2011_GWB1_41_12]KKS25282.1 MAG: hypothetical protein UU85_C0004G0041 [Candidatus Wolfebacteria bacterium GW2011_GWA2_42_10]KKT56722.1 MAG: hypothetical protein UW50_C0001G0291 [Candidatus Wolfebacteria bacterium GW2011_GWA1_44_24]
MKKIILFSIFCFVFSVMAVQAAGLVPCGGAGEPACNFCHLKTLAENVINFALYNIAIPVTVIFIVYGGFVILTAGESAERAAQGRKIIQSAIIGVLIAVGAWLIIREVIEILGGGSFKPWEWGKAGKFC